MIFFISWEWWDWRTQDIEAEKHLCPASLNHRRINKQEKLHLKNPPKNPRMGAKGAAGKSRGLQRHTLNSSEISDTKDEICFMSLSTLLSLPVFSSVVMASVAMLLLESVMRFSRSRLQAVTAEGCFMATCKEWIPKLSWSCVILQFGAFDAVRAQGLKWILSCGSWVWQSQITVVLCSSEITIFPSRGFCDIKHPGFCFLPAESPQIIKLQLVISPWPRNERAQPERRRDFCPTRRSGVEKPILQHGIIPNKVIPRAAALLEVTNTSSGTGGCLWAHRTKLLPRFWSTHFIEGPDGRVAQDRLGGAAEKLQHCGEKKTQNNQKTKVCPLSKKGNGEEKV